MVSAKANALIIRVGCCLNKVGMRSNEKEISQRRASGQAPLSCFVSAWAIFTRPANMSLWDVRSMGSVVRVHYCAPSALVGFNLTVPYVDVDGQLPQI